MQRKLNAETPSQKAQDQRSIMSRENKVSSSKQDHTEVEDEERRFEENESQHDESSGKDDGEEWGSEGSNTEMILDEFKTLKKYHDTTKGKKQLLMFFSNYLGNIFGSCKQENQAILHTHHVHQILEKLHPEGKDEHV